MNSAAAWQATLPLPPSSSGKAGKKGGGARTWTRPVTVAIVFAMVALTLLDRFGLAVSSSFSIHPTFIAMYAIAAAIGVTGAGRLNAGMGLLYVCIATVSGLSLVANASFDYRQVATISSWLLLVVLYLPFVIVMDRGVGTQDAWQRCMRLLVAFMLGCGIAGIAQYFAQYAIHAPWLFDFTPMIPKALRGSGTYNTTNVVGEHIKSNGFFLREASGFSFYMALALLLESSLDRRKWVMAVLGFAVVLSYSGSGLLVLAVAMLFPLGQRTLWRVLAAVALGAVVVVLFGDALNINYTLSRVGEFGSDRSSAYCRFIAPGKLVVEQIDSAGWTTLLGHGPGTTQKMFDVCETTYGKLVFEYGLLGMLAFGTLVGVAIHRSGAPIRVRVALTLQWLLLGGNLLAPESLLLIFMVCAMWPRLAPAGKSVTATPASASPAPPAPGARAQRIEPAFSSTEPTE
jgi:hypothetical protein